MSNPSDTNKTGAQGQPFSAPFATGSTGAFSIGSAPADDSDKDLEKVQKRLDQLGITALKQHQAGEGEEEEEAITVPRSVVHRLMALKQVQAEKEEFDKEYLQERTALELKYAEKLKPLYQRRFEVVTGKVDVQIKFEEEEGEVTQVAVEEDDIQGIPEFWSTVLRNNSMTNMLVTEEDLDALKHLVDIRVEYPENMAGFSLVFQFTENEYFTNETLTKTYVVPDMLDGATPSLESIKGTDIDWKPKKNLTVVEVQKKQRAKHGRNKGTTRVVTKEEPKHSFFNFFKAPVMEEEDEEEEPEDEEGNVQLEWEDDYEFAHLIRSSLIPNAVSWFIGELGDDEEDDEEDDENDEEGGDEDEEEDEEEDDDEPDAAARPVRGGRGGKQGRGGRGGQGNNPSPFAPAPGGAGQQQECKQS